MPDQYIFATLIKRAEIPISTPKARGILKCLHCAQCVLSLETSDARLTAHITDVSKQTEGEWDLIICLFLQVLRTMHRPFIWLTENERPCVYTTAYLKWTRFLLHLFPFVTVLHFLEIYPQSVLLKPAFLKKLSFKNVKHIEKWKSQKRRLFTATPLGFPHLSGSPCWLAVLEVSSTVDFAGNPLWSGSEWSPNQQSRPFPRRQCSMCWGALRTIRQSSSKRRSPFKVQEKERPFGRITKGTLFSSFRGGVDVGPELRGSRWIWRRPSEGGSQYAPRFWWTELYL